MFGGWLLQCFDVGWLNCVLFVMSVALVMCIMCVHFVFLVLGRLECIRVFEMCVLLVVCVLHVMCVVLASWRVVVVVVLVLVVVLSLWLSFGSLIGLLVRLIDVSNE